VGPEAADLDRPLRRVTSCTLSRSDRFLRQAWPGFSPYLAMPARSALADGPVIGSMWRLADGEHGGD
jgi:hypothetical protein